MSVRAREEDAEGEKPDAIRSQAERVQAHRV